MFLCFVEENFEKRKKRLEPLWNFNCSVSREYKRIALLYMFLLQVATLDALYFFIFLGEIDRFSTTVGSRKFVKLHGEIRFLLNCRFQGKSTLHAFLSVSVSYPRSNAAASRQIGKFHVRREPKFPNFNDEQMRDSRDGDNTTLKWKSARVWEFYYT